MRKCILIAEDDDSYCRRYAQKLHGQFEVLEAATVAEARRLFEQNRNRLAGVIMDGCLGSIELNTLGIIREIRQAGWRGKMIAASTNGSYRKKMLEAGCDEASPKYELSKALPGVFG